MSTSQFQCSGFFTPLTLDLRSNEKLEFENTERCEWSLSGIHIERILGGSVGGGLRKGKC